MPAPDYAQEIAALEEGIARNELTVEQDGERVTYKSTADMLTALRYFEGKRDQAAAGSSAGRFGFSAPAYCRK